MYEKSDKIILLNGSTGTIVEVLKEGEAFIVDVDKENDWDTIIVLVNDIKEKIK